MIVEYARLEVDEDGWVTGLARLPSPNCDPRPQPEDIELVVIHAISLPPRCYGGPAVVEFFSNRLDHDAHPYFAGLRALRVSAHFFIRRDGAIVQFVPTIARAWHAGVSRWQGRERCNDFSVGIELEGADEDPYTEAQYANLRALVLALAHRHPIRAVAGHCHIAPERKTDPGPFFEWSRLSDLAVGDRRLALPLGATGIYSETGQARLLRKIRRET